MNHPLASRLQALVAELSGKNPQELDPQSTFFELGLDSLFLTQLSRELSKVFGVKLAFRQLAERWPTIEALARHLAERVPLEPETAQQTQPSKVPVATAAVREPEAASVLESPVGPVSEGAAALDDGSLYALFAQQLELMSHQLAALAGSAVEVSAVGAAKDLNGHAVRSLEVHGTGAAAPRDTAAVSSRPAEALERSAEARAATTPRRPMLNAGQRPASDAPGDQRASSHGGQAGRVEPGDLDQRQQRALRSFIDEYSAKTRRSKLAVESQRRALVDPRASRGSHPLWDELCHPLVIARSSGSRVWDVDGNEYVDLLNGCGANLLGHNHPVVVQALRQQLEQNLDLTPLSPLAAETAALVCELTGMERASFLATDSEAVQAAIRCARAHTGRDKIVVFEDPDHGGSDEALVRPSSSEDADRARPSIAGAPARAVADAVVLPYAQSQSLDALRALGNQVAAVLIEPVPRRRPELQPREFLHQLRALTEELGALLIFDETVTGFRCHLGGAQAYFELRADLAIYGKVCGGGLPIGVLAGSAAVMDALERSHFHSAAESRPLADVSPFAGAPVHPLALAGSLAVLRYLRERGDDLYHELSERTTQLVSRLNELFEDYQAPLRISHFASSMYLRREGESELGSLLWPHLVYYGVHVQRGLPSYLTLAHDQRELSWLIDAFQSSLEAMARCGFHPGTARRHSGVRRRRIPTKPPVAGARLGKDAEGRPAWFVADPNQPRKYVQVS